MTILREFIDEALSRGETLKEEISAEILKSKVLADLAKSELFAKAVSTVIKTKDEVAKIIKQNVKTVLQIMDVPSRNDLAVLKNKLDRLEKVVDKAGKKAITVRSLNKMHMKKAAKAR